MENRHNTNRQRLPEQVIKNIREFYRRPQEFLQTVEVERTREEKVREEFRKQLKKSVGSWAWWPDDFHDWRKGEDNSDVMLKLVPGLVPL